MAGQLSVLTADKKIKLEVFTRAKAIPRSEKHECFPVLVRVTAPESMKDSSRLPVDIVAVLDVSSSMGWDGGERLRSMKQAMEFVIGRLREDDRLSVVSFATEARRLTGLTHMDDSGREEARRVVGGLVANGGTNMGKALEKAALILRNREAEESNNRRGCIIFLSDGDDNNIYTQPISNKFPVHTFGLSEGHDPMAMRHIADMTSGIYSFINKDMEKIKDAFAMSIGGLTTVTAMSIHIDLQANEGISILSVESGGYESRVSPDNQSGTVKIDDLYAGETKNFIVYLGVTEGKKPPSLDLLSLFGNNTKLLTVHGRYKNPSIAMGEDIEIDSKEASVTRPEELRDEDREVSPQVAAELVRLRLVKDVTEMLHKGIPYPYRGQLQNIWDSIKDSDDGKAAGQNLSSLMEDIKAMEDGIGDAKTHRIAGLPYMLSWLTSHKWQRATTRGSPSKVVAFQTSGMKAMVQEAVNPQLVPQLQPAPAGKTANNGVRNPQLVVLNLWEEVIAWTKSKPYSDVLSCVVVLVVLLLMVYLTVCWSSSGGVHDETTPTSTTMEVNNILREQTGSGGAQDERTSPANARIQVYDISKLSDWYKIEKNLHLIFQKVQDPELASFLQDAPVEVVNRALHQYLYLAIVHASAVEKRYASIPNDVDSNILMLEQEVARLEGEKKELSVKIEVLVDENEKILENTNTKCASKESEEALLRANTRIDELERQLHDKKAFVESLLSEMANNDAHLKTCGERVDMLEAKVRLIEGSVN